MSSSLFAAPAALASASSDLSGIGEAIREATAGAGASTTAIAAPAADEVSAAITELFGGYGREFQALSAASARFHAEFARLLGSGGAAYAAAEAASADPLTSLVGFFQQFGVFSPVELATGRPLFGNGANGAAGTGQAGADGGWIIGNGGNGGSGGISADGVNGQAGGAGGSAGLWG
ncbi:PE family protein, partial [Mycobacterium conspicuum]